VSKVNDKSGNNVNLSNATGYTYPNNTFNGTYPSFYFPTSLTTASLGSNASFTLSQPITTFFVGVKITSSEYYNGYIFDGISSRVAQYGGQWVMFAGGGVGTSNIENVNVIASSVFNTTNSSNFLNGTLQASGNVGTNSLGGLRIANSVGAVDNWVGHYCEFLMYNSALATTQRQQVEGYLAWKWGLQASLPATHPYKTSPIYATTTLPPQFRNLGTVPMAPSVSPFSFFNPTQIPSCKLWLDGYDRATVILSSGVVSQWNDKSGNGYNMTQGTPANRPGYQNNYLVFNGTTNVMTGTLKSNIITSSSYSIFLVGSSPIQTFTSGERYNGPAFIGDSVGYFSIYLFSNAIGLYNWDGGADYAQVSPFSTTTPIIATGRHGSDNLYFNINGNTDIVTPSGNTQDMTGVIQLAQQWNMPVTSCSIGEVVIYNTTLTNTQCQMIQGYLAWKWGLPGNLPSNHPFKNVPPGLPVPPVPLRLTMGSSSFSPFSIAGLGLWLDGSDRSTLFSDSTGTTLANLGDTIGYWKDKSGSNRNYIQTTSSYRPNYSTSGSISFPTQSNTMVGDYSWTLSTGYSIFAVSKPLSATTYYRTLFRALNFDNIIAIPNASTALGYYSGSFRQFGSLTLDGTATALLYVSISTSYAYSASLNGTVSLSSATGTGTGEAKLFYSLGNNATPSSQPWGTINEIIIYPSVLTLTQRQQVEGYLAWKWGLQGNLPANHPFSKFPPQP
jgi:hypothetical protein